MIKRLVITGYRQHELGVFDEKHPGIGIIKKALRNQLLPLLDDGPEWVIFSGQLGVETWAAELVIELKDTYPQLHCAIITPFLEQEQKWNDTKKEKYQMLCQQADFQTSVTKRPYEGPWQMIEKNKFVIRNSDGLLIVYDEENVGSPKFIKELAIKYAERHEYQIITISADDLQMIAEEEQQNQWPEE